MDNEDYIIDINAPYDYFDNMNNKTENQNKFTIIEEEVKSKNDDCNKNNFVDQVNPKFENKNLALHYCNWNQCLKNVIKCETCKGYFSISIYNNKHHSLCTALYKEYYEKEALVECDQCNLKCKISEYNVHLDKCLEMLQGINKSTIECKYCHSSVKIENIEEHEANCEKITSEVMILTEQTDCNYCKDKLPLYQIELHELNCKMLKENKEKLTQILSNYVVEFPKIWKDQESQDNTKRIAENTYLIEISSRSIEYKRISDVLITSLGKFKLKSIKGIYCIQNEILWNKFYMEKLKIEKEKGSANILDLFYNDLNVDRELIFKNGFDISFAVDSAHYGRGIYFNRRSESVIEEAILKNLSINSIKYIIMAKVILGVPHYQSKKNSLIRKPPFLDKSKFIYYDSITNRNQDQAQLNIASDQTYVIYNNEKAYPLYCIELDELSQDNSENPSNIQKKRGRK